MAIQQTIPIDLYLTGDGTSTSFTYSFTKLFALLFDTGGVIVNPNTIPSSATVIGFNATLPTPTTSLDGFGNLIVTFASAPGNGVSGEITVQLSFASGTLAGTTAAWTSATALNTAWTLPLAGSNTVTVGFVQTGSITGGTILFEVSQDGANWFPIQGALTNLFTSLTGWQPGVGSLPVQFDVAGFSWFRLRLNPVLTGTGTVTFIIQGTALPNESAVTVGQSSAANLNATVINAPTATTAGALSAAIISATGAKTLIKGSTGNLYGMYFLNNTAVASWIQFFNSATVAGVTLGTTVPVWAAPIAANGTLVLHPGTVALLNFAAGIVYAATSTLQGATTESMSGTVEFL